MKERRNGGRKKIRKGGSEQECMRARGNEE